jgi:hypothetical protein
VSIKAMKQALEALEWNYNTDLDNIPACEQWAKMLKKAITSLRQSIEQAEQQDVVLPGGGHVPAVPVAVYGYCPECGCEGVMRERHPFGNDKCTNGHRYPSSQALSKKPEQTEQAQPVAWFRYETVYEYRNQLARCTKDCIGAFPVYTSPPPRQPLTEEQIQKLLSQNRFAVFALVRAVEAAHGIKE